MSISRHNSVSTISLSRVGDVRETTSNQTAALALGSTYTSWIDRVGAFFAASKRSLFQVVFLLMKEDQMSARALMLLSLVVEHLQFLLFFVSPSLIPVGMQNSPIYTTLYQISLAFNVQSILGTGDTFWSLFWFASTVVLVTLALLAYLVVAVHRDMYIFLSVLKLLRLSVNLLSSVLYLPFVRTLIHSFLSAQQTAHSGVVAAVCILTLFIVATVSKGVYFDNIYRAGTASARPHGRVDIAWVLLRTVLVIFFTVAPVIPGEPMVISIALAITLLVGSIAMLAMRAFLMPYYERSTNELAVALSALLVWGSLTSLVAMASPTMSFVVVAILLLVGSILLSILGGVAARYWFTWYFLDALRTPVPQMVWKAGMLTMYVQRTHRQQARFKQSDYAAPVSTHSQHTLSSAMDPAFGDSIRGTDISGIQLAAMSTPGAGNAHASMVGGAAALSTPASMARVANATASHTVTVDNLSDQQFARLAIEAGDPGTDTVYVNGNALRLRSVYHVELFARILMHDESGFVRENVRNFYAASMAQFPRSPYLLLSYARFLECQESASCQQEAIAVYEKLERLDKVGVDIEFFCYAALRVRKRKTMSLALQGTSDDGGSRDLGVVAHLELQQNLSKAKDAHFRTLRHLHSFWQMLLADEVNLHSLETCMHRIVAAQKSAHAAFSTLVQQYPKAPRILRAYSRFVSEVRSDVATAQSFMRLADQYEQAQQAQQRTNHQAFGAEFSELRAKTSVSLAVSSSGAIKAGRNLGILNYVEDELLEAQLAFLVPHATSLDSVVGLMMLTNVGAQEVVVLDSRGTALQMDIAAHRLEVTSASTDMRSLFRQQQLFNVNLSLVEQWRDPVLFASVTVDDDGEDVVNDFASQPSVATGMGEQGGYDDDDTLGAVIVGVTRSLRTILKMSARRLNGSTLNSYVSDATGTTGPESALYKALQRLTRGSASSNASEDVYVRVKSRTGYVTARANVSMMAMQRVVRMRLSKIDRVQAADPTTTSTSTGSLLSSMARRTSSAGIRRPAARALSYHSTKRSKRQGSRSLGHTRPSSPVSVGSDVERDRSEPVITVSDSASAKGDDSLPPRGRVSSDETMDRDLVARTTRFHSDDMTRVTATFSPPPGRLMADKRKSDGSNEVEPMLVVNTDASAAVGRNRSAPLEPLATDVDDEEQGGREEVGDTMDSDRSSSGQSSGSGSGTDDGVGTGLAARVRRAGDAELSRARTRKSGESSRRASGTTSGHETSNSSGEYTSGSSAASGTSSLRRRLKTMRQNMSDEQTNSKTSGSVKQLQGVVYVVLALLFVSLVSNFVAQDSFLTLSENKVLAQADVNKMPVLAAETGFQTLLLDLRLRDGRLFDLSAAFKQLNASGQGNSSRAVALQTEMTEWTPPGMSTDAFDKQLDVLLGMVEFSNNQGHVSQLAVAFSKLRTTLFVENSALSKLEVAQLRGITETFKIRVDATGQETTRTMSLRDMSFLFQSSMEYTAGVNVTLERERGRDTLESLSQVYFILHNAEGAVTKATVKASQLMATSAQSASVQVTVISTTTLVIAVAVVVALMWLTFRPVVTHIAMENHFTLETFLDIPRRSVVSMVNRYRRLMLAMEEESQGQEVAEYDDGEQGASVGEMAERASVVAFSEGSRSVGRDNAGGKQAKKAHGGGNGEESQGTGSTPSSDESTGSSADEEGGKRRRRKKRKKKKHRRSVRGGGDIMTTGMHLRYVGAFVAYLVVAIISFFATEAAHAKQAAIQAEMVDVGMLHQESSHVPFYVTQMASTNSWAVYNSSRAELSSLMAVLQKQYAHFLQITDTSNSNDAQNTLLYKQDLCAIHTCYTDEERKMGNAGIHQLMQQYLALSQNLLEVDANTRITFDTAGVHTLLSVYETLLLPSFDTLTNLLKSEIKALEMEERAIGMAIMFAGILVLALSLVIIFTPMMAILNSQAKHVEHMFLMIPLETLIELPHVMKLLGLDVELMDGASVTGLLAEDGKPALELEQGKRQAKSGGERGANVDHWLDEVQVGEEEDAEGDGGDASGAREEETSSPTQSGEEAGREGLPSGAAVGAQLLRNAPLDEEGDRMSAESGRVNVEAVQESLGSSSDSDSSEGSTRDLTERLLDFLGDFHGLLESHPRRVVVVLLAVNLLWWIPTLVVFEAARLKEHATSLASLAPALALGGASMLGTTNVLGVLPVMVPVWLLIGESLGFVRDFHLLVQALTLPLCTLFAYLVGAPLDLRVLGNTVLAGFVGSCLGLLLETQAMEMMLLASIVLGFVVGKAMAILVMHVQMENENGRFDARTRVELFVMGVVGGVLTSSAGSGMAAVVYLYMSLYLQVDERVSINTSVSSLGITSVFALCLRLLVGSEVTAGMLDVVLLSAPVLLFGGMMGVLSTGYVSQTSLQALQGAGAMSLYVCVLAVYSELGYVVFGALTLLMNGMVLSYLLAVGGNIRSATLLLMDTKDGKEWMMKMQRAKRRRKKKAKKAKLQRRMERAERRKAAAGVDEAVEVVALEVATEDEGEVRGKPAPRAGRVGVSSASQSPVGVHAPRMNTLAVIREHSEGQEEEEEE